MLAFSWRHVVYWQVREAAVSTLVEFYRHVGERVRIDIAKKNLSQQKYVIS